MRPLSNTVATIALAVCVLGAAAGRGMAEPITDGLALWLDAADTGTLYQDAALTNPLTGPAQTVRGWADKAALGGTNNATKSGGSAPSYQTNVINGSPALAFNRSQLTVTGGIGIPNMQDRTIFLVMNYTNSPGNSEILGRSTAAMADVGSFQVDKRLRMRDATNGGPGDDGFNGIYAAANSLPYGSHLLVIEANGSGTFGHSDGITILDRPGTTFQHYGMDSDLGIGGANFSGREYVGNLAEVLIYNRALTSDEINEVGFDLEEKYGLDTTYTPEPSGFLLLLVALLPACRKRTR